MRFKTLLIVTVLGHSLCSSFALATEPSCPRTVKMLSPGAEKVRIACFGDSLTGVYYHTGGRRAYCEMLAIALKKVYPAAQVESINAGLSGDTTRGALKRFEREVLDHRPHLVTVMFGMNDMNGVPLDEYRRNLGEIISRCRKAGAEVVLCTSNSVVETPGRPSRRLEEYMQAVRDLARDEKVPLADCYRAYQELRKANPAEWSLLLSDEIHPNMDGHKLMATTIADTVSSKPVALTDVGPPQPAIPHTLELLRVKKQIRVFAMPPFDELIGPALQSIEPAARVEVTKWDVSGKSLAEIQQSAKIIREKKPDLVIVAVPPEATDGPAGDFHRSFAWVLNWSLSFGRQEWDCFAVSPSVVNPHLSPAQAERDRLALRLIRAQDLDGPVRKTGETQAATDLLHEWLRRQRDADSGVKR